MPAITLLPELLVLPRRIELRSPAFQTGVITRPTQAANKYIWCTDGRLMARPADHLARTVLPASTLATTGRAFPR